jgi:hypothetical protein
MMTKDWIKTKDLLFFLGFQFCQPPLELPKIGRNKLNATVRDHRTEQRNIRIFLRKRITTFFALPKVARHCSPCVRLGKPHVVKHPVQLLVERLFPGRRQVSPLIKASVSDALTSYMISFSAVVSARRLFTNSHCRLVLWSSTRDFSRRVAFWGGESKPCYGRNYKGGPL